METEFWLHLLAVDPVFQLLSARFACLLFYIEKIPSIVRVTISAGIFSRVR
jgi:hypothetical protein